MYFIQIVSGRLTQSKRKEQFDISYAGDAANIWNKIRVDGIWSFFDLRITLTAR